MSELQEFDGSTLLNSLRRWSVLLVEFLFAQGLGQAAGMLSGLIFVRVMPVDEYALYALCMTALAMISLGSDLGLSGSLGYFWRRSRQNLTDFGPKLAAVRLLRNLLFGIAAVLAVVMLTTSAGRQNVSLATIGVCSALLACTAWLQVHNTLETYVIRLEGRQRQSYYAETAGSFTRLVGALVMLLTGVSVAIAGVAGGLAGALASWLVITRLRSNIAKGRYHANNRDWAELKRYALPVLPGVLFYMAQEPIVMWMAAANGGSTTVAEVFALNRIAAILAVIGSFSVVVAVPRLAGISDDARFIRALTIVISALFAIGLLAMAIAYLKPNIPLLIVGSKYSHLHSEVILVVATGFLSTIASLLAFANRLRGWVALDPYLTLTLSCLLLAASLLWQFDSAHNVILLNLLLMLAGLIAVTCVTVLGLRRPHLVVSKVQV